MSDDSGFRVTGRMVLFGLIGFFGLITVANAIMIWLAVSTNTGVVVESSYKVGTAYQHELEEARAQAERDWAVTADIVQSGEGATIDIVVRDKGGAPVSGLDVTARLSSAVSEANDRRARLSEGETGRYRGTVETLTDGHWMLTIDAMRGDERMFRSENRVTIR